MQIKRNVALASSFVIGALLLAVLSAFGGSPEERSPEDGDYATSANPLSFGPSQTIIDLNKVTWAPLELEGFPPGLEVVLLRGDLAHGSELLLRTPAGYLIPNHNHTSAETYVWLKGSFTYINGDGRAAAMSGQSFVSLPGSAPPHAIRCEDEACILYVRFPRAFDHEVYPMPEKITPLK